MTTLSHTAMSLPAATRPATWARVMRGGALILRMLRNRSAFIRLSELTDRELADIGLSRGDIMRASMGYGDPTSRLNELVSQRLSAEDAARRVS
jgi:uncharacterized protein YjiS (DUF1127 family)